LQSEFLLYIQKIGYMNHIYKNDIVSSLDGKLSHYSHAAKTEKTA